MGAISTNELWIGVNTTDLRRLIHTFDTNRSCSAGHRLCLALQNFRPNTRRVEKDNFDIRASVRAGGLQYVADSFLLSLAERGSNGPGRYRACGHGRGNQYPRRT